MDDNDIKKAMLSMRDEAKCAKNQENTHLGKYPRIRYGDEKEDWEADKYPCHDCLAIKGEVHDLGCDVEECPVCHHQLIACGHLIDGKFSEPEPVSKFSSKYPVNPLFMNSATKEYFIKFMAILGTGENEQKFLYFWDKNQKRVLYCDKVLEGEKLEQSIERIMSSNFGIKEIISIIPKPMVEHVLDKNGETRPRAAVTLVVKYEDLKVDPSFPYKVEWLTNEEFKT